VPLGRMVSLEMLALKVLKELLDLPEVREHLD
jgi:hypothetical protein